MADHSDPAREAIHAAIQANAPRGEDAVLTGWALVAEWMDHDGERWLTKSHAPTVAQWAASGMHHEALYGRWPEPSDDQEG
jgi:hypothetical protein